MMPLQDWCQWLNDLPLSTALSESDDAFPLLETLHVLSVSLIVGTVITVDLHGLEWSAAVRGRGGQLYVNPAFRLKILLLGLAGLNALLFHLTAYRSVAQWDQRAAGSASARAFAAVSIVLWAVVIVSGRMTAVFHGHRARGPSPGRATWP